MILRGKTISPGIVRGTTHLVDATTLLASALDCPPQGPPLFEIERLNAAIGRASVQLDRVRRQLMTRVQSQDVGIFSAHAGLLRDSKFIALIQHEIYENGRSADAAVATVVKELYASFLVSGVSIAQDKATDILDIGRRLVECLSTSARAEDVDRKDAVIVAAGLTPSELVRFAHQGAVGFVLETCGAKSHTGILARSLGLPIVTNIKCIGESIANNAEIVLDGTNGVIVVAPTEDEQVAVLAILGPHPESIEENSAPLSQPLTADQVPVQVLLNISDPTEASGVPQLGAAGIGLFRTEFMYMDRPWWPTDEESLEIYRDVARRNGNAELTIRLVDFGAEKCPPYADIPLNRNPSLGLRGMRLLMQREDILQPQVRALAALGRERPLTVLLPMLDTLDTLEAATARICRISGCRSREQLPFRLGTMIEIPAAALMIDDILKQVDEISIGLNDLTQYLLAADRDDELVEPYHDALQPCVLRIIEQLVAAAGAHQKPVTICGELAGDPHLTSLLLGLGIRRLSVSRSNYVEVVRAVQRSSIATLQEPAAQVLRLTTGSAVRTFVSEHFTFSGTRPPN
jgi:phosphoenolpyruvate-protein phosphotransferase